MGILRSIPWQRRTIQGTLLNWTAPQSPHSRRIPIMRTVPRATFVWNNADATAARYACPDLSGNYRKRAYVVYPQANLVLDFGPDRRLRRWITFTEEAL